MSNKKTLAAPVGAYLCANIDCAHRPENGGMDLYSIEPGCLDYEDLMEWREAVRAVRDLSEAALHVAAAVD